VLRLTRRILFETDKRLLWKLAWTMGWKGMLSVQKHKARLRKGEVFPPFLYVSIINSCNLRCQGCWSMCREAGADRAVCVSSDGARSQRDGQRLLRHRRGEPFMHPDLLDMLAEHPDCYFQIFTNGHFITDEKAKRMRQLGNITPLISVEGTEIVSDERRGRSGVLSKSLEGIRNCLANRVFTGVCTSLCQTNIDDLLTETWIDRLIDMGVMYTWFHVYRPMGRRHVPTCACRPRSSFALAASWSRCVLKSPSSLSMPTSTAKARHSARPRRA